MPVFLYGHSWGGYAADAVSCLKDYSLKGILSVSAYYEALGAMQSLAQKRYGFMSFAFVLPATVIQRIAYGRAAGFTAAQGLNLTSCPIMIVHSKEDSTLSYKDNFIKIKTDLADRPGVQFWAPDGENHNVGAPWDIVKRRRLLQRQIEKAGSDSNADTMLKELWELYMAVDDTALERFIDFFEFCAL
jgi:pimeloyl-ACP methyl ester carboxylesterase